MLCLDRLLCSQFVSIQFADRLEVYVVSDKKNEVTMPMVIMTGIKLAPRKNK